MRRPAYLALASIRDEFAGAPVMACTATATKQVQATIIESLRLKAPVILDASANREQPYPVLSYEHPTVPVSLLSTVTSSLGIMQGQTCSMM